MTAATITELSTSDIPMGNRAGTAELRRAMVFIRYTSAAASDTIALASYISNLNDIEGILYDSMDSAKAATSLTWSTTTITCAGDTGSHVGECGVIVNFV